MSNEIEIKHAASGKSKFYDLPDGWKLVGKTPNVNTGKMEIKITHPTGTTRFYDLPEGWELTGTGKTENKEVTDECVSTMRSIVEQMQGSGQPQCVASFKGSQAAPAVTIDMHEIKKLSKDDLNHLWQLGLAVSGVMAYDSKVATYPIYKNETEIYRFLDGKGVRYVKTCTIIGGGAQNAQDAPQNVPCQGMPDAHASYADGQLFLITSEKCPFCNELTSRPDVMNEVRKGNIILLDDNNPQKFVAMRETGVKEEPAWVIWSASSGFMLKSVWDKSGAETQGGGMLNLDNQSPTEGTPKGKIDDWYLAHTPYLPNSEYSFNYQIGEQWGMKELENFDDAAKFLKNGFPNVEWTPVVLKPFTLQAKDTIWISPNSYTLEQPRFTAAQEWIWRVSVWNEIKRKTELQDFTETELIAFQKRAPKKVIDPATLPDLADVLYFPAVIIVTGARRMGKTGTGYMILEIAPTKNKYVLGLPEEAEYLLPTTIQALPLTTETLEMLPMDSIFLIDEASLEFYAKQNRTKLSETLDKIILKTGQKGQTLVFASHNLRKLLSTVVLEANIILFKDPSTLQAEMERPEIMKLARRAKVEFDKIEPRLRVEYAFCISDNFFGMVNTTLPSFWTEKLSTSWRTEGGEPGIGEIPPESMEEEDIFGFEASQRMTGEGGRNFGAQHRGY